MKRLVFIFSCVIAGCVTSFAANNLDKTTKQERNFVKEGIKAFNDSVFDKAVMNFNKALEIDPTNELIIYNIATSQFALGKKMAAASYSNEVPEEIKNLINAADSTFNELTVKTKNPKIKELSAYNAGNIAFSQENYQRSIENYKTALRTNPDNDEARQNLRLAQLKLQQQQQNQDQQQDQQDQEDQEKQEQEQQQQEQQQNQNQNQQQQQQNQQQQQQQGISQQNAEQILKAMENAESQTRKRVEQREAKEQGQHSKRVVEKPW